MISIVEHLAVIALLVTILSNFSDCDYCPASAPTVSVVSKCPTNKTEWDQAASRKKCSHMSAKCGDKSPVYHCLLNQWGNETVEVCASTWYMSGFCAIYNTDEMKVIDDFERDCTKFSEETCPSRYISSEAYMYQKCYMKKSSNTIPLPDRTEETNDCITSTVIAIVVTVLVLVITSLVVFITLRLKISKKVDEKCMPFCNATKQKAGGKEKNALLMDTDIQQERIYIEEDGVDPTRLGVLHLKARFDNIQRMARNTNNDAEGTSHEHINIEGNGEEVEQKMDNTIKNDVGFSSPESLINEENNDEEDTESPDSTPSESVTDTPNEKPTEVEEKMDDTIKNDVGFSSPESLINEENNDEENTESPDSTPSESVTDTPNEKPTDSDSETEKQSKNEDSDSETEKQSKNEENEKKAVGSYDGKVSQGGVLKKAKIFGEIVAKPKENHDREEKSGNVLNARTTWNLRNT